MNFLDMDEQIYSDKQSVDLNTEQITGSSEASDSAFADTLADILARAEKEDLSVEEAFAVLEQIVQNMEDERISLEDSFSCYEAGIRLVRYCSGRIDRVEKKVQMLRGEGQAPLEEE